MRGLSALSHPRCLSVAKQVHPVWLIAARAYFNHLKFNVLSL